MVTLGVLGELLPSNARAAATGVVNVFADLSFFTVVKFSPALERAMGLNGMFWMFACIGYALMVYLYFHLPETYGRTLEDIEEHYRQICNEYNRQPRSIESGLGLHHAAMKGIDDHIATSHMRQDEEWEKEAEEDDKYYRMMCQQRPRRFSLPII